MNTIKENEITSDKDVEDTKAAFEPGGSESVTTKIQENLDYTENPKFNIAITGESGSGMSTFVNAIRGLDGEDEGAAETGIAQTTMKPTNYPHPKHRNVNLWDLPGIGTPNFKLDDYFQQVNFSQYDFFIIIASERFKENHAKLVSEIQKRGKNFYFVHSKVDIDIDAIRKRRKSTFNEEKILEEIRQKYIECLQKEGVQSPCVYLLSSFEPDSFDFPSFRQTLEEEISVHNKRYAVFLVVFIYVIILI
ncbi:interferon-gamma-inducible GTPase 10-like [Latimeria chalumnae]|uniref:interferon-gamma-inducible GTPase 10-like n=1 Tax=Latimeria chalumnae TaxID=7897 RepID=UPI0003C11EE8